MKTKLFTSKSCLFNTDVKYDCCWYSPFLYVIIWCLCACLVGIVFTANNGGFTSIRTKVKCYPHHNKLICHLNESAVCIDLKYCWLLSRTLTLQKICLRMMVWSCALKEMGVGISLLFALAVIGILWVIL